MTEPKVAKEANSIAAIDALRSAHGKIVTVELAGKTFCFRKPKKAEIVILNKAQRLQPELNVEHSIGLCRSCFLENPATSSRTDFESAADEYCLAFAGTTEFDGVAEALVDMSTGEAAIVVK